MSAPGPGFAIGIALALLALGVSLGLGRFLGRRVVPRAGGKVARILLFGVLVVGFAFASAPVTEYCVNLMFPPPSIDYPEGAGIVGLALFPVYLGATIGAALDNLEEMFALWGLLNVAFVASLGWQLFHARKASGVGS